MQDAGAGNMSVVHLNRKARLQRADPKASSAAQVSTISRTIKPSHFIKVIAHTPMYSLRHGSSLPLAADF